MTRPLEPTQFTRESAERIANVVRAAELATPAARVLSFDRVDVLRKTKVFRICTFTGAWPIGSTKTVTFKNQTATPNTVSAVNLFFPLTSTATSSRDCAIAKDGTAWYLIDVLLAERTAVFVSSTARVTVFGTASTTEISFLRSGSTSQITFVQGISTASGSLSFLRSVSASLNTSNCSITVTQDQGTATYVASVSAQTATATNVSVGGTQTALSVSMSGTQTLSIVTSTFTARFLTLENW